MQNLAAIGLRLERAYALPDAGPERLRAVLQELRRDVATEIDELRRTIGALRPLLLDQRGLAAAVRDLAEEVAARAGPLRCQVVDELGAARLRPEVETALFRVAQQALANVERHAAAGGVRVALRRSGPSVVLSVEDDGRGFDLSHVEVVPGHGGFGLISMRERVQAIGGRLAVHSRPGGGTRVEAQVPAGEGP
ncbi:MAG TPA: sensor histidine kinase [Actinomycetes bacterium]|nr:sensor histidine kinase [Actinomycetes bacterium]